MDHRRLCAHPRGAHAIAAGIGGPKASGAQSGLTAAVRHAVAATQAGFADRMNRLPKHVASTTLTEPLEWNATLLKGDVAEEVQKLKQQPGQDILIYGSGELVNTLMRHNLIDVYRLMIHPVLLGGGKPLFWDGQNTAALRLADTRTTSTGMVMLTCTTAETDPTKRPLMRMRWVTAADREG